MFQSLYKAYYNWRWPIPSDDELSETEKSIVAKSLSQPDTKAPSSTPKLQLVCVISFDNGDHDVCFPRVHDQMHCDMVKDDIKQKSGRDDVHANMLDSCGNTSKTIGPSP